jgi:hypothetical protein
MAASIGYGTTFSIGSGSPLTYTAVAQVTSVTPPNYARDAIEATHMTSPGSYREFIPGLMDAGEATIELNYIASATDTLIAALDAGVGNFRITFPNGVDWNFTAIVTAYAVTAPLADKMTATATFKVTGEPTLTA